MHRPSRWTCSRGFSGAGIFVTIAATGLVAGASLLATHRTHPAVAVSPVKQSVKQSDHAILFAKSDVFLQQEANQPIGESRVLVRLQGKMSAEESRQLAGIGGQVYRELPIVQSVALRIPRRNLDTLASLPFVARLSSDTIVRKTDEFIVQGTKTDAAVANYGVTGSGIGVAIVDTGIDRRADLSNGDDEDGGSRIVAFKDFVDTTNKKPLDEAGHGTHVAGIVAGNGQRSTGRKYTRTFTGIAPQAKLIGVRVLDREGNGSVSNVIAGLSWIVENKNRYNIRVANVSLGHPVGEFSTTDPLCQAVEAVWKSGIVVVCSAGNYGRASLTQAGGAPNEGWGDNYGSIQSPANSPYVITVGATKPANAGANQYDPTQRASDKIATYSSRGPSVGELTMKPDILAPGNRVISVRPKDGYLPQVFPNNEVYRSWYVRNASDEVRSKDYYVLSGTSMASPVVAGAAALLLQKNPNLTPDTVKARLLVSADKWTAPDGSADPFTYGAGYLNVNKALSSKVRARGYAVSPTVTVQNNGTLSLSPSGSYWVNNSLWGTGVQDFRNVYGSALSSSFVFANNAGLYDTVDKLQGDIILWGSGGDTSPRGTLTTRGGIIMWGQGGDIKPGIIMWGNGGDVKPTIILWGQGGNVTGNIIMWGSGGNTTPIVLAGSGLSQVRQDIILWGNGGNITPIPVSSDIILWGSGGNTTPSIIMWGNGGDIKPAIILWGQGGNVTGDIIMWGQGGGVKPDIILWGNGGNITPSIIMWGSGGGTVTGDIILWGNGGGGKVTGDIILWGNGGDIKPGITVQGEP